MKGMGECVGVCGKGWEVCWGVGGSEGMTWGNKEKCVFT